MIDLPAHYRPAIPDDAPALAELVNFAGEGLPLYLWTQMAAPGQSPWDLGRQRARRDSGGFSYRNAIVREEDGDVVAALIGYPLADEPEHVDYSNMPPMFVPLQQLEDLAPGTWYINVIAAYPEQRGKGIGTDLMSIAEQLARETGMRGLSLVVADSNVGARRLYERCGYREIATRAIIKEDWDGRGENWVLLVKNL